MEDQLVSRLVRPFFGVAVGGLPGSRPATPAGIRHGLEARVGERTSVARELHDTLLQSFHGLLPRFQVVSLLLPERPEEAKEQLDATIDRAAKAIAEGRDAVQGLRASTVQTNDLALALNTIGEELATDPANHRTSAFRVTVEGEARNLHPILRDEIYRIAAEALRTRSGTPRPGRSRLKSDMTIENSGSVCGTTEKAWIQ